MTIPTEILSKAREIYEGSWPDPVTAIAEALMEASGHNSTNAAVERPLLENTWGEIEIERWPDGSVMITQHQDDIRIDEESLGPVVKALQKMGIRI